MTVEVDTTAAVTTDLPVPGACDLAAVRRPSAGASSC